MPLFALALSTLLAAPVLAGPPVPAAPPTPPTPPAFVHMDDDDEDDDDDDRSSARLPWEHMTPDQVFEILKTREAMRASRVLALPRSTNRAVEIIVPIGFFIGVVLTVGLILLFRSRRERERYATIRHCVERGAELPPSLLDPPRPPHADLRRGLLLAAGAGGLGLCLGLLPEVPPRVWTIALMPALVALAYLANWVIGQRLRGSEPAPLRERHDSPRHDPTEPGVGVGGGGVG